MQASGQIQRQTRRRSPGDDTPRLPPNMPLPSRAMSPVVGMGMGMAGPVAPRSSTSSNRSAPSSSTGRRNNATPSVPLSQIEKSVTHLLVATKQLLETLTQWSRGQATDTQVSDVYVRLGYEFNMACRAFTTINVDTSDLGNVPEKLRSILEATLSQEASSESLENYLPRIRDIIIDLLHGLKRKQLKLRQKQARERDSGTSQGLPGQPGLPGLPGAPSSSFSNGPTGPGAFEASNGGGESSGRSTSISTTGSSGSGLTTLLNESIEGGYREHHGPPQQQQQPPPASLPPPRDDLSKTTSPSRRYLPPRDQPRASADTEQSNVSDRTLPPYADSSTGRGSGSGLGPGPGLGTNPESISGSLSGTTAAIVPSRSSSAGELNIDSFPPPPPPKSQQSALMALQRNGDHLERRASRRYSQYQIQKHLGSSFSAGVPLLPTQNTPVPNRGRGEIRESLRAVQVRETMRHARSTSSLNPSSMSGGYDSSSPVHIPQRASEERDRSGVDDKGVVVSTTATAGGRAASPSKRGGGGVNGGYDERLLQVGATLNGPPVDLMPAMMGEMREVMSGEAAVVIGEAPNGTRRSLESTTGASATSTDRAAAAATATATVTNTAMAIAAARPVSLPTQPPPEETKELTLFLQYKSKVKKVMLPDGYSELTMGRLQLAFIEKFSWNTQQNGADLPEIYIQDPVSGVRHELEDLTDIKDRTVLALNVEPLDEVKRHIDDGIGTLKLLVMQVKQNVDEQGAALQRVSDRQQEASKEMARLATAPPVVGTSAGAGSGGGAHPMTPPADSPRVGSAGGTTTSSTTSASAASATRARRFSNQQLVEVQNLRRDLAVLRQTYSNFQSDIQSSMTALRNKAGNLKAVAVQAVIPDLADGKGQAIVAAGRKKLSAESDRLVAKVDDLQDLVEDLRKDVVHRGVRPLPRQLESVTKEISQLAKDLTRMEEGMKRDKPVWTKIWEHELEEVCKGRDELQLAEDLLVDLQDDLEKASETFALVEQATKEQMKDAGPSGGVNNNSYSGNGNGMASMAGGLDDAAGVSLISRQLSRGLKSLGDNAGLIDPSAAREGLLGEVRALQPNHENRLEAIERAEKLRQKELESRRINPMMQELHDFVEEGRLKKSGGFEEVERARKAKDDRIRREVWERMNGVILDVDGEGEGALEEQPSLDDEGLDNLNGLDDVDGMGDDMEAVAQAQVSTGEELRRGEEEQPSANSVNSISRNSNELENGINGSA